ncbi:thioredoxin-disulfide reductase [Candidatus Gottesmanbacteria bacterium]|nr:thioredoxin-disulfide reductase [Candidatus Gottesmanbacteria bacterium]
MSQGLFDVIILGSGPAALTAGLYTSRADLKTLIIAGTKWGGQLQLTTLVENYPGFPQGIQGPDLMINMRKQTERFGAIIVDIQLKEVDVVNQPFTIKAGDQIYQGKTIIIATGADTQWLSVPGEKDFLGKGVSSCAPCDAFFYRNKRVIVIGGGDSAMEEALVLTKFATEVTIIHRRDSFRASKIMQDRVIGNKKIKILWNSTIKEILGKDKVTGVKIETKSKGMWEMPIDGIFVAIGHTPNTVLLKGINLDSKGFVARVEERNKQGQLLYFTKTNRDGVFTAGDVHDYRYKQAVTAAGFGCMAALDVEKWLEDHE